MVPVSLCHEVGHKGWVVSASRVSLRDLSQLIQPTGDHCIVKSRAGAGRSDWDQHASLEDFCIVVQIRSIVGELGEEPTIAYECAESTDLVAVLIYRNVCDDLPVGLETAIAR